MLLVDEIKRNSPTPSGPLGRKHWIICPELFRYLHACCTKGVGVPEHYKVPNCIQILGTIPPSDTSTVVHPLVPSISEKIPLQKSQEVPGGWDAAPHSVGTLWSCGTRSVPAATRPHPLCAELPARVPISAKWSLLSAEVGLLLCNC